jgi:excisionase family DNA binding protein
MATNQVRNRGDWVRVSSRPGSAIATVAEQEISEKLLTEVEVARRLRLSRSTLFTLRRTGKIGYVQVGTSIRYRAADVRRFIEENAHNG